MGVGATRLARRASNYAHPLAVYRRRACCKIPEGGSAIGPGITKPAKGMGTVPLISYVSRHVPCVRFVIMPLDVANGTRFILIHRDVREIDRYWV